MGQLIFRPLDDAVHLLESCLEHAGSLGGERGPLLPLGLTHLRASGGLCNVAVLIINHMSGNHFMLHNNCLDNLYEIIFWQN